MSQTTNRGQLIIIAGILLAITLVSLSFIVNSAIYTESLSTRSDVETNDAVSFRGDVLDGSRDVMYAANFEPLDASYATRKSSFSQSLGNWRATYMQYISANGVSASATPGATVEGTRVSQEDVGNFDPADPDYMFGVDLLGVTNTHETWVVANDTEVRRFQMEVQRTSVLYDAGTTLTGSLYNTLIGNDPFTVGFDDADGNEYYTFVYESTGGEVAVATYDPAAGDFTTSEACTAPGSAVTVDVTGGQLVGEDGPVDCPALSYVEDLEAPYEMRYYNGDNVEGTYDFIAKDDVSTFRSNVEDANDDLLSGVIDDVMNGLLSLSRTVTELQNLLSALDSGDYYQSSPSGTAPYTNPAMYSRNVQVSYTTADIEYSSTLRIAPGEAGETTGSQVAGGGGGDPGNAAPDAEFSVDEATVSVGDDIDFDASASSDSDGSVASYEWEFGDGATATGATALHSYGTAGQYTVTLTVTDDDGATATQSMVVQATTTTGDAPEIQSWSFDDKSNNGQGPRFRVDWDVHDDDGDLDEVTVELKDGPNQVDSVTTSIGGGATDESATDIKIDAGSSASCSQSYTIVVTVTDQTGREDSESQTVTPSC